MKKIAYAILAAALAASCARDENVTPVPSENDSYTVAVRMALTPSLPTDNHTEPMTRVGNDTILTSLANQYRYLIYKDIGGDWYVERDGMGIFRKSTTDSYLHPLIVDTYDDLQLELRPGDYRITIVGNHSYVAWNQTLTEGTPVGRKDGSLETPWLFQYKKQQSEKKYIKDRLMLNNEIFVGSAAFTVAKTGDLHSDPAGNPVNVSLKRMTSWYRPLLKEDNSLSYNTRFNMSTAHTWIFDMESLDAEGFPLGVDVWGEAWYPDPANKVLQLRISSGYHGYTGNDGTNYMLPMPNATEFFPMIITDRNRTEGYRYKITFMLVTGQSGHLNYYYPDPGVERVLYPNAYGGIVLKATNIIQQVETLPPSTCIIMEEDIDPDGKRGNPAKLFPRYYEWNN